MRKIEIELSNSDPVVLDYTNIDDSGGQLHIAVIDTNGFKDRVVSINKNFIIKVTTWTAG